ncbi:MAG: hypothetical protein AAGG46_03820 [Planctomycetota bacterium]
MNKQLQKVLLAATACPLVVTLVGCGNGLATVSGRITVDGEPIAVSESVNGRILFFPDGGTGAPAVGALDSDGEYSVSTGSQDGLLPGPYVVTVLATELIPSRDESTPPSGRSITPRRYADPAKSGLRVNVADGSNEFDFDLDGTPDPPPRRRRR